MINVWESILCGLTALLFALLVLTIVFWRFLFITKIKV